MRKLGCFLTILVLVSMVIPASAQKISDEDMKIQEEIQACFSEVDKNEDLTVAEKTVAKRDCETTINNKYSEMNNNHQDLAEQRNRIQTIQKCEDWYPSYKILDEEQWRIQKHTEHASNCLIMYNDGIWNYDGDDRLIVLADRLLELKEDDSIKHTTTTIDLPYERNIISQDAYINKISELESKVAELQEELRKKDEVLKEQIKVISDLANMIKNAMLNAFLPNGILF